MELIINQNGGEKSHGVNDVTEGPSAKEIIKCFFGKSKGIIYLCTNIIYLQKDRQKRQLVFVFFFSKSKLHSGLPSLGLQRVNILETCLQVPPTEGAALHLHVTDPFSQEACMYVVWNHTPLVCE